MTGHLSPMEKLKNAY